VKRQEFARNRQLRHAQQDRSFKKRQTAMDVFIIIAKDKHVQLCKSQHAVPEKHYKPIMTMQAAQQAINA
jgi:hypothetical protein